MSALTPIDQVIRQLCRETGEPDYKNYDSILSHVRGAIIDLNLYVIPSVKTKVIQPDHLGNLAWPCDCVQPLLISLVRNKVKCLLSVDSGVANYGSNGDASLSEAESCINEYCTSPGLGHDIYYRDANGTGLIGRGFTKICNHDKENRLTHINARIKKGDAYEMTYISAGVDEVTHVPVEAETPIGEWVFWKYYRRSNPGLSDRGRDNYKEEYHRLTRFYADATIEDWINAIVVV